MKSVLCMLLFSLIFNACGDSLCYESGTEEIDKAERSKVIDYPLNKKPALTESKCHLLNEWLNRKSMSHFLKNHISLNSGISVIKKNHFNDTFIP